MTLSDHELMHRSRLGDPTAFDELVRRWENPIGRVVARLLGTGSEVEDVCQEVFLRVLRAKDRYQESGAFSTWLYRIALNLARDTLRRRKRWSWLPLADQELKSPAPPAAHDFDRRELGRQVELALAALPEPLREVLVLKHFGQLTLAEIALVAGLPTSTIKSRVQTALERLRSELARRGIDEQDLPS
jgi:RNA polymerase sigma-70 factor (ECF subfamily)